MNYSAGQTIYKYKLLSHIGGGAFGEVWLANDGALNSQCALKLLPPDASVDERLLEARIGSRLNHANVVNIKYADIIQIDNTNKSVVTIAMPYYSHGAVTRQLNSCNFLDTKTAVKCLIDVLRGLEYLHENGYYHCDIKPNNILIGDNGEFILSDYGITCFSPEHTVVTPKQFYLPHTAPETYSHKIYDERTDVYQMGITAFRLFNSISSIKTDFVNDHSLFKEKVEQGKLITKSQYRPYVPNKIMRILTKATACDPNERYQTALEMRRAFEQLSICGTCSSDVNGNVYFISNGYRYRYEIVDLDNTTSNFISYKRNINSGRETKATKYCASRIKHSEVNKMIHRMANELL